MEIFGLDPILGSVIIAVMGIAWAIFIGYAKAEGNFDFKKLATSVAIGFPGALILVATGINAAGDVEGLTLLVLIVGWIMQISGTDSTVKGIASIARRNKSKTS
jgi:hypothetical protein